jgi:V/A-type H+/Na+-transporting ATPase subunit I
MIVPMSKVYIATQGYNNARLLDVLGQLGVVHIKPVDSARAVAQEQTVHSISALEQALRILQVIEPEGKAPEISALDAAKKTIAAHKMLAEQKERLSVLHRTAEQIAIWGNLELNHLENLKSRGIEIKFYSVVEKDIASLEAECLEIVGRQTGKNILIAVVDRAGKFKLPEGSKEFPWPNTDLPAVKKEASEIDASVKQNNQQLKELANLTAEIQKQLDSLKMQADFTIAQNSGLSGRALFAIQGWVPSKKAELLSDDLIKHNITAAVEIAPAGQDEEPPTLVEYPGWTRPIKGLFDVLGTVPGYNEFDVSIPFMLALPIFAAMLIADGGYGAVLFLGFLLGYKKFSPSLGADFTKFLIVVGAVSMIWGLLCGSFFGFVLYKPPIPVDMSDKSRFLLMEISFFMGAIHLSAAQSLQALRLYPNLTFLNKAGWAIFIWGMLGVVRMFVLNTSLTWATPWPYCLIVGATLAILFNSPSKNIIKMLLLGIANFPLSMLGAFSDTISYARLMAVGLAGSVLAGSFNDMALSSGSWFIAIPAMVGGHALNLGLAMVSLFSHGVRLNMLEFSNNLGMQWSGYSYKPFKINQE